MSVFENTSEPKFDRLRKDVIAVFHNEVLNITIDTNLTTSDFIEITLDLFTGKQYPYRKPSDNSLYVNAISNHPPIISKQLPKMVKTHLSSLFINEDELNEAKPLYEKALKSSGFNKNL